MSARLRVLAPGLRSTVQDLGRHGFQALGVPVAGVLDMQSSRLANRVVGNDEAAAVLEYGLLGPSLAVEGGPVRVALGGATVPLRIEAAGRTRTVAPWRAADLEPGAVLHLPPLRGGIACAVLAVAGGIDVPPLFGSRSTDLRSGFGGLSGRALAAGDVLPLASASAPAGAALMLRDPPDLAFAGVLRVVLGPQRDAFTEAGIAAFLAGPYRVTREADRMGLRLEGPAIEHRTGPDIVSDGIANGAIQVPGSRQPILLLADHQTTGGYTKIAHVISADLPKAGRLSPGAELRFAAVTVEEAEAARAALEAEIAGAALVAAPDEVGLDLEALARENLISGVFGPGTEE